MSSSGRAVGQCQPGLPGGGDLPRPVLSLAPAAGALRAGRRASAPAPGPARPPGATGPGDGAAAAERGGERGDVGRERIAAYLRHRWQLRVAPSTVQRALRRAGLATRRQRLTVLEHRALQTAGLLTERTRRSAVAAPSTASRAMSRPASPASWCVWTPSTSGSSRAWARSGRSRPAMPRAPTAWRGCCPPTRPRPPPTSCGRVLMPLYRRAGWRLRRVLTDGGPEFKGAFDEACRALGLRHTRTKPRHAWTNGFVERLQGTILQEHWRVAFRRRYFTSRPALQRSLEALHAVLQPRAAPSRLSRPRPHPGGALLGRRPGL